MEKFKDLKDYQIAFLEAIRPYSEKLHQHPTYGKLQSVEAIRVFMGYHIYAVWDFMSLVKFLQQKLTTTSTPWMPKANPELSYLINEIVLGEESDVLPDGSHISHFELYKRAMAQAGAGTQAIDLLIGGLSKGKDVYASLEESKGPAAAIEFSKKTFEIINTGDAGLVAAVFSFGREDLIPQMFISILDNLSVEEKEQLSLFRYYLERHIEVDGDHHSHLAWQMTCELLGDNPNNWVDAALKCRDALSARISLWDAVGNDIDSLISKIKMPQLEVAEA